MVGKNCARALPTLAVAEASRDSWRRISGRWVSSSDGIAGCHPRCRDGVERPTSDADAFRRARDQRGQCVDVLRQRRPQRRHRRALVGKHTLLLGDIQIGPRPGPEALLDGVEDSLRAGDIALGGADAVLRGQDLEIGIGDGGQRRQRDGLTIEPAGIRRFLGGQRRIAVLAPEIQLIACRQRGGEIRHLAAADREAAGARSRGPGIVLLSAGTQGRQQGGAGDSRLRIGLPDPRHGSSNIQIDGLRFLHELGQFVRAEAAPPVQRRRCGARLRRPGLAIGGRDIQRRIGQIGGQHAAGRRRGDRKRRECAADDSRWRTGHCRHPNVVGRHSRKMQGNRALMEADCDTFTG